MHAKIVSYQDSTGRGVIMNIAKCLFDFNKETWHDPKITPAVGLLVECRLNGKQITDAHASRYQEFNETSLVSEADFWKTDNDDELENMEEKKRLLNIQTIYRSTNYSDLKDIEITLSVAQAIKNYFALELTTTDMISKIPNTNDSTILDYKLMKRFILKALDTLLFSDRLVMRDHFIKYTSLITRIENSYQTISRFNQINTTLIFEEYFLKYQTHYQALLTAISTNQEGLAIIQKKLKNLDKEVSNTKRQESLAPNSSHKNINDLQENLQNQQRQSQNITHNIKKLEAIKDGFYQRNLDTFKLVFDSTFKRITKKLKEGLDLCGTLLDDQIWETAAKSSSLKAQYFKNNAEENICAMSFASFYLSHLDEALLSTQEENLLRFYKKTSKKMNRYYLIVSSDIDLTTKIKVRILAQRKYNIIKHASKPILFQSLLKDLQFTQIFITENIEWGTSEQILAEIQESKKNKDTKIQSVTKFDKCEELVVEE